MNREVEAACHDFASFLKVSTMKKKENLLKISLWVEYSGLGQGANIKYKKKDAPHTDFVLRLLYIN